MVTRSIIFVCTAVVFLGLGIYMLVSSFSGTGSDDGFIENFPVATTTPVDVSEVSLPPEQVLTESGALVSATPVIESPATEELADGFYALSDDPTTYDIFYNEPTGVIFISLYKEPLSFSRALAERKLIETLQLPEAEICAIPIKVTTNAYVDPSYDGANLGLSFCEDSVQLP